MRRFVPPTGNRFSAWLQTRRDVLCVLRSADDGSTRSGNHESARDDCRRDCHCCGKASSATCNRRAARWHVGNHRGGRVLLCSFPAAKLARFILPCFPFTLTVRHSDHENISHCAGCGLCRARGPGAVARDAARGVSEEKDELGIKKDEGGQGPKRDFRSQEIRVHPCSSVAKMIKKSAG